MRHHTVLLQSIYSTKASGDKATYYDYAISQARADVFFSLLFGGQIMASAGAFFDSTIAVRVFGELFSHPRFKAICTDYGWRPLRLNSDGVDQLTPVQFLTGRWRNPKSEFTFFRESDPMFWQGNAEAALRLKIETCEAIEQAEFARLNHIMAPLFASHSVARCTPLESDSKGLGYIQTHLPAILTPNVGDWLKAIFDYLKLDGTFTHILEAMHPEVLQSFAPVDAVATRTLALPEDTRGNFDRAELIQLNSEFKKKTGGSPLMGVYHIEGPSHYGHYYQLVNYWVEAEWHATRHRMYGSDVCILSSDWSMRDNFDFDIRSKVTYLSDAEIDDSLRVAQESFADIDWEVLFSVVTDWRWNGLIDRLHVAAAPDAMQETALEILDLLANRMTEFTFNADKGRVSILAKNVARVGAMVSYVGVLSKFHSTLEGLVGASSAWALAAGGAPAVDNVSRLAAPINKVIVKGMRYVGERYGAMCLRRAIVPNIYAKLT